MASGDEYFLGHSSIEQRRLQQQAEDLAADSIGLFDQLRLSPGCRVVEIEFDGCRESLERHLADPDTVVMWAYFQAWGTKPERQT
jgi:hypothetical protein